MKKATQWNIAGILALVIGVSSGMSILCGSAVLRIGEFDVYFGRPFVVIVSAVFSFMCFISGLVHGLLRE